MMDYEIDIQIETAVPNSEERLVEELATAVFTTLRQEETAVPAALTVLLADDTAVHTLNKSYRGEDKPTDVLSFEAGDPMPGCDLMPEMVPYLGDVIISVPTAQRQAEMAGHPLLAELQLLVVHGTLHLLGFDHADETEKAEMWAAQTAVMTRLGLSHVTPTEG